MYIGMGALERGTHEFSGLIRSAMNPYKLTWGSHCLLWELLGPPYRKPSFSKLPLTMGLASRPNQSSKMEV